MDFKTSALGRLEERLRACFFNDSTLADFSDDTYFWSGQNIRGKICLELGKAYGLSETPNRYIASTQLLHDASLIHDDLIDETLSAEAVWRSGRNTGRRRHSWSEIYLYQKLTRLLSNQRYLPPPRRF